MFGVSDWQQRLRNRLGTLWWYSSLQFCVSRFGDVVNIYIALVLVPDVIPKEQLGVVLPLTQILLFVNLPFSVILQTALKFLSVFHAEGEFGKIKKLLRDMAVLSMALSAIVVSCLLFGTGFVQARLKFHDPWVIPLIAGIGIVSCWQGVTTAAIRGLQEFRWFIIHSLLAPFVRIVFIALLLRRFQLSGYFATALFVGLSVVSVNLLGLRRHLGRSVLMESYHSHLSEMGRFLIPIALMMSAMMIQTVVEPWVIRHRLAAADSAGYYMVAILGGIPAFMGAAIAPFFFPIISRKHERGESTRRMHGQALMFTLILSGAAALLMGLFGSKILCLRKSWKLYSAYAPFIWQMGLMGTLRAVSIIHMTHEAACRRFGFLWYSVPILFLEAALLYALMGWGFFRSLLPAGIWQAVDTFIVRDLQFVFSFMLGARLMLALCVLVDILAARSGESRSTAGGQAWRG